MHEVVRRQSGRRWWRLSSWIRKGLQNVDCDEATAAVRIFLICTKFCCRASEGAGEAFDGKIAFCSGRYQFGDFYGNDIQVLRLPFPLMKQWQLVQRASFTCQCERQRFLDLAKVGSSLPNHHASCRVLACRMYQLFSSIARVTSFSFLLLLRYFRTTLFILIPLLLIGSTRSLFGYCF
jgi:hypothetical protein